MEILLLITIIAVAASGLYVAVTFNKRTRQTAAPLIDNAIMRISREIEENAEGLTRQLPAITDEVRRESSDIRDRLNREDPRITDISRRLLAELETIKRGLSEQIDRQQEELGRDLLQLDHRVAQLGESLSRQSTQIAEIYSYSKRRETQDGSSPGMSPLAFAMLEAEAHADRKGWGQPPHLYALTATRSPMAEDNKLSAELREAGTGGLIPVEQDLLLDGDPIEVLANIHWPEDVVGCVLVTELKDMPPRGEDEAPTDPAAAGQWASPRPDGRPARLAVGVGRNGQYTCGLRIKGDDDVQVRTELAGDLVTALLGTF